MVKNITIKDEAYEFLKSQKGERSFSDVILASSKQVQVTEPIVSYGQTHIAISMETKKYLDSLKKRNQTYDEIIRKCVKKPSRSFLTIQKYAGSMKEDNWDADIVHRSRNSLWRSSADDRN